MKGPALFGMAICSPPWPQNTFIRVISTQHQFFCVCCECPGDLVFARARGSRNWTRFLRDTAIFLLQLPEKITVSNLTLLTFYFSLRSHATQNISLRVMSKFTRIHKLFIFRISEPITCCVSTLYTFLRKFDVFFFIVLL